MSQQTAAYAQAYARKYGLAVVKIEPGLKFPRHPGWNSEGGWFDSAEAAVQFYTENPTWNLGVVLGPSRLCSLDVDNVIETKQVLSEFGIDIDEYAAKYPTIQGNPSRFRVEFRVPEGVELGRHALNWPNEDDPSKSHVVFELRAGPVQDVFPPSIHPETKQPYTWVTKPNGDFPQIPERLLAIWKNWDVFVKNARALAPNAPKEKPRHQTAGKPIYHGDAKEDQSVIGAFCQAHDVGKMLERYGYEPVGNRWLSPHSQTKLPGVVRLDANRVYIHHASDPLYSDPPHPIGPFDLYCYYEHSGDVRKAVKAAANLLGLRRNLSELRKPTNGTKPERIPVDDDQPRAATKPKPDVEKLSDLERAVLRMAEMSPVDYESARRNAAKELNVRTSVLDAMVNKAKEGMIAPDESLVPIETSANYGLWQSLGLDMTKNGPLNNLNNAVLVMTQAEGMAGKIWFDEFSHRIQTTMFGDEHEWCDHDTLQLTLAMQRNLGLTKMTSMQVREAVTLVARRNVRNSAREYMEALDWDGTDRLRDMLTMGWGVDPSNYASAVGRCWMVSMVARVYEPGCQVDTVPVFEGPQGLRKSTALRVIGGPWYAECHEQALGKDFYMTLEGRLLVEIAEMHTFSASEIRRVKGVISGRIDRYRAPYAMSVEDHARQAVMCCTTNEDDWNRDPTGARRFWPIKCHAIDIDWLENNRDQLFAEAVHLYKVEHIWHDVPNEDAVREQEARRFGDAWDDRIKDFTIGRTKARTQEIMEQALELAPRDQSPQVMHRISAIMKSIGWEQRMLTRQDGSHAKARYWVKTGPI